MPVGHLPFLMEGSSELTSQISVHCSGAQWTYFLGMLPVFTHEARDKASFRMYTSQLYVEGHCQQTDIMRVFGVSKNSVIRSVATYRKGGIAEFFKNARTRGPAVLKGETKEKVQHLLDQGYSKEEVAKKLGLDPGTLRKAINSGRLHLPTTLPDSTPNATPKSTRNAIDAEASTQMGTACTRSLERTMASVGLLTEGASTEFVSALDVSYGGLLIALPALDANGLFRHLDKSFPNLTGYYRTFHIILIVAYMALARIKTVEKLRYEAPGELGKLMGLDRIPEVRCLRHKLTELSSEHQGEIWQGTLSKEWMEDDPHLAGTLYVDGHVSVYHGSQVKIPKKFVSRQRLCLRGTTGYWVNDSLGRPFFVIERVVDDGMLSALRADIVPRLLNDVPCQPNHEELRSNRYKHRFTLVFDREGFSPQFFKEMWQGFRISCVTYRKNVNDHWPEDWFESVQVPMPSGEIVAMKLAERGTYLGDGKKDKGLWVREVRKLKDSGHQTSLISTEYEGSSIVDAGKMFSRWSQENFFRYMMQHYSLDRLSGYSVEEMAETQMVVNPQWRTLDSTCKKLNSQVTVQLAKFAKLTMNSEDDAKKKEAIIQKKAELLEVIQAMEHQLSEAKEQKSATPKRMEFSDLPEDQKFMKMASSKKHLVDTIKMITYRAETALSVILRPTMKKPNEARALVRDILTSEADLYPDPTRKELNVHLHFMTTHQANESVKILLAGLNQAEYVYPGTDLKIQYFLGPPPPKS